MWRNSLNEQRQLLGQTEQYKGTIKNLEKSLGGLTSPNPSFAIEKLKEEQDPQFMYPCKTVQEKKELLVGAIKTEVPDIILTVLHFLKMSLTLDVFDSILLPSHEAVTCYLRYLIETKSKRNQKEWKRIVLAAHRYDELALYLYDKAVNATVPEKKLSKLQDCLRVIKQYNCLTHLVQEIENLVIESSLKNMPQAQSVSLNGKKTCGGRPSQEISHGNDKCH